MEFALKIKDDFLTPEKIPEVYYCDIYNDYVINISSIEELLFLVNRYGCVEITQPEDDFNLPTIEIV